MNENSPLNRGMCVEIIACRDVLEGHHVNEIGLVLDNQLVELDQDLFEYLYTVHSPRGIDDYWAYEIKLVNYETNHYNNNIATQTEKKDGSD